MDKINPYQSPQSEQPSPDEIASPQRPTVLRCSLFGLYAGAILGATSAGVGMLLLGFLLAAPLRESRISLAVGGVYFGAIGGGLFGAVLGSPLAVAARLLCERPGRGYAMSCGILFAAVIGCLGGWMSWRLTRGLVAAAADGTSWPGEDTFTRMIALGLLIGAAAGLHFARRTTRFVFDERGTGV